MFGFLRKNKYKLAINECKLVVGNLGQTLGGDARLSLCHPFVDLLAITPVSPD